MNQRMHLSRRTVLRGLGTMVALPWLEAMGPVSVLGAAAKPAAQQPPLRTAFLYVPNGMHMQDWKPDAVGLDFKLKPIMEPLAELRKQLTIFTGLSHDKAKPNGDGPGDHARAGATFLTGMQARKTSGKDIRVGMSVDQFAARDVGSKTRFPSLELGCDPGLTSGNCDSGYSCAYSANISWRTESQPMAKETNPRAVFDRIFGNGTEAEIKSQAKRDEYRKSILDFVMDDASDLQKTLGAADKRKVDEYLDAVREVERRIEMAQKDKEPVKVPQGTTRPDGTPRDYDAHIRLMGDLITLAFQTDQTRIATFMIANEGSNRNYRNLGITSGHHDLSHHGRNAEKQASISKINRFHMEQVAYILKKMQSIQEGDRTLLENSMVIYGSCIGDGDRHNHNDLPVMMVGSAGGRIKPGSHVKVPDNTPMTNLFLTMLKHMDVRTDKFGDSTGPLTI